MKTVICPYCGAQADYINSSEYYSNGVDYGMIYICRPCDAICGVHKGTDQPLGSLAKQELRKMRRQCHALFDPLHKSGFIKRHKAYLWLGNVMEMTPQEAHIGLFREADCERFLSIWKSMLESVKPEASCTSLSE